MVLLLKQRQLTIHRWDCRWKQQWKQLTSIQQQGWLERLLSSQARPLDHSHQQHTLMCWNTCTMYVTSSPTAEAFLLWTWFSCLSEFPSTSFVWNWVRWTKLPYSKDKAAIYGYQCLRIPGVEGSTLLFAVRNTQHYVWISSVSPFFICPIIY